MSAATPRTPPPEGRHPFPHPHLLAIAGLQPWELTYLLDEAEAWVAPPGERPRRAIGASRAWRWSARSSKRAPAPRSASKWPPSASARTSSRCSPAARRLTKGETLLDTALTLGAMRPDVIVIRHGASGAPKLISEKVGCPVLNAGDGSHEHPTQALLDALTIRRRKGRIEGLTVTICGDILHSRVARSNFACLTALGAHVRVVAPPTLMPADIDRLGVEPLATMEAGLEGADVIMMLRLQRERMEGAYIPSRARIFPLLRPHARTPRTRRARCARHAPRPDEPRGGDRQSSVADDIGRSAITQQVEMGVAVRMACLDVLTRRARGVEGWA